MLWRKRIDHLVTELSDGSNMNQCVEVSGQVPLLIVSVYMPCKGLRENVEEFADCVAKLIEIYQKYTSTHRIMFGGDFNEDLNPRGIQRESVL